MFGLFRKKRNFDQLIEELRPTLETRNDSKVSRLFNELAAHSETEPEKVEVHLGWGILVACELKLPCTGEYLHWFMETFPDSVQPVKIEYASYLVNTDQPDLGSQLAREYLRLVRDAIGLSEELAEHRLLRRGVGKAFLLLTAVYTCSGARSYSRRVLQYAMGRPVDPAFAELYESELNQLAEELQNPEEQEVDQLWDTFFQRGENADQLFELCREREFEILATRVDLIEGRFRFNPDFRVDEDEIFLLVHEGTTEEGQNVRILR